MQRGGARRRGADEVNAEVHCRSNRTTTAGLSLSIELVHSEMRGGHTSDATHVCAAEGISHLSRAAHRSTQTRPPISRLSSVWHIYASMPRHPVLGVDGWRFEGHRVPVLMAHHAVAPAARWRVLVPPPTAARIESPPAPHLPAPSANAPSLDLSLQIHPARDSPFPSTASPHPSHRPSSSPHWTPKKIPTVSALKRWTRTRSKRGWSERIDLKVADCSISVIFLVSWC